MNTMNIMQSKAIESLNIWQYNTFVNTIYIQPRYRKGTITKPF